MTGHEAHAALACFGFRQVAAARMASSLSEGERLRLSLCMTGSGNDAPELLLLYEPTNHLDMARTNRLLKLLDELRGRRHPTTAQLLAESLGVSVRTIYRDLATLQAEGAAITAGDAGYLLDPAGRFAPPSLTAAEADAILLGLRYAESRDDPDLAAAARSARRKLIDRSPAVDQQAREPILVAGPARASGNRTRLLDAIRAERRIEVSYRDGAGTETRRRLWPLAIGLFDDCETLAAWCELRDGFRHFRLDRIGDLTVTDERLPRAHRVLLAEWRREARLDSD